MLLSGLAMLASHINSGFTALISPFALILALR